MVELHAWAVLVGGDRLNTKSLQSPVQSESGHQHQVWDAHRAVGAKKSRDSWMHADRDAVACLMTS